MGKRSRKSKNAGKALDAAFRLALSGPGTKEDSQLFYEDKEDAKVLSFKEKALKKRQEEEEREAFEAANRAKLASRSEEKKVEKLASNKQKTIQSEPAKKKGNVRDLWDEDEGEQAAINEWVKSEKKAITNRERLVRSKPASDRILPKVKVVAPGGSYHPSLKDYEEVVETTVEKIETRARKKAEASRIKEMEVAAKLPVRDFDEDESESSSEEEEEEEEQKDGEETVELSNNQKKKLKARGEKLTRAERNKQRRKRLMEVEERKRKKDKALKKRFEKINQFQDELDEHEKQVEERAERTKERKEKERYMEPDQVASNGKKIEREIQPEFAKPDDLTGSMRLIRPLGNLALDRFDSMHVRNLMEVSAPGKKKRKQRWTKDVEVGEKFIDEEFDTHSGQKKRKRRMTKNGKILLS